MTNFVNYDELRRVVDEAKMEYGEELHYQGLTFLLFSGLDDNSSKDSLPCPAFYSPSSLANWDIYLYENLIDSRFRKTVLLHEILEAERFGELSQMGIDGSLTKKRAHEIARVWDDKYARDSMDSKTYKEYCQFRTNWENPNIKNSQMAGIPCSFLYSP